MRRGLGRLALLFGVAVAALLVLRDAAEPARPLDVDAASVAAPPPGVGPARRVGPCDVTHVTDGDTLNVRCGALEEKVRLLQIDTPEREDVLYEEARAALDALIAGRRVELELGFEDRDDYGRLLAYVFAGGENLNLAMIREGWSPYFDRYGAGAYPREFAEAELAARERGVGIWARAQQPAGGGSR